MGGGVLRKVKRQRRRRLKSTKIARFTRLLSTSGGIERKSVSVETRWDRTHRVRFVLAAQSACFQAAMDERYFSRKTGFSGRKSVIDVDFIQCLTLNTGCGFSNFDRCFSYLITRTAYGLIKIVKKRG